MDFLRFQLRAALLGNLKPERLYREGAECAEQKIACYYDELIADNHVVMSKWETKSGEQISFKLVDGTLLLEE